MRKVGKTAWTAWAIKNIAVVVCFTALAVYFGKWWIVLFAAFFTSSLQIKVGKARECDGCGKTIFSADDDLDGEAQRAGWIRRKNGEKWEDYCPECQRKGRGMDGN